VTICVQSRTCPKDADISTVPESTWQVNVSPRNSGD